MNNTQNACLHHMIIGMFSMASRLAGQNNIKKDCDVLEVIAELLDYHGMFLKLEHVKTTEPIELEDKKIWHEEYKATIKYSGNPICKFKCTKLFNSDGNITLYANNWEYM